MLVEFLSDRSKRTPLPASLNCDCFVLNQRLQYSPLSNEGRRLLFLLFERNTSKIAVQLPPYFQRSANKMNGAHTSVGFVQLEPLLNALAYAVGGFE